MKSYNKAELPWPVQAEILESDSNAIESALRGSGRSDAKSLSCST